tara:strand:+ start:913 stop:1149 length:237 start_codon:yes stop_codon:yes gene_type:complete
MSQLPFFTCPNHFYTKEISRDVKKYTYCKDNGIPPYPGDYGDQPARWVSKHFAIKSAFAKKESIMLDKAKSKSKSKKR